jgi:hypothetical protein
MFVDSTIYTDLLRPGEDISFALRPFLLTRRLFIRFENRKKSRTVSTEVTVGF